MSSKKLPRSPEGFALWYDAARVRILMDYRPALRQRTGVGQYVHELASALIGLLPAGDSLVLFSSSWKDRLDSGAVPGAQQVDARIPVSLLNAAWHRLEWPTIEMMAGAADIAHSLHPLLMPARHAVQVVTVHDLDFLDHPERTRAEVRRDYPALAARHARRADLVVANSAYTGRAVTGRLGVAQDRLVVCRPGVPSGLKPRDAPVAAGPILFVGTIEPRKNLGALFAAYEELVARYPEAPELVLAGGRVESSSSILAPLATNRTLSARVRYVGYVSDEERYALYRAASMLVLPSFEEGFGMTALEAMYVGVPVVASDRGALPEVIGDAAALIDPLNPAELAGAMLRLLSDPGLREARTESGRARARQFTWSDSARQLLDAYRRALARRGTRRAS